MTKQLGRIGFMTLALAGVLVVSAANAEEEGSFSLGNGGVTMTAPKAWEKQQPRFNIVEHEFAVPASEGDEQPGRLTIMGAGGSVEDNIGRWAQQFESEDGGAVEPETKKMKVAGQDVYWVDIKGTYLDRPAGGPFAPGPVVPRENYRMLAAIVMTEKAGNYFLKLYGPAHTITDHEAAFKQMVEQMQVR